MSQKLKMIVQIENENGETVIKKISEREIPDIGEFDKQGFRISFAQVERAFLTGRKEVSDEAVSEYIELISKKKLMKNPLKTQKHL